MILHYEKERKRTMKTKQCALHLSLLSWFAGPFVPNARLQVEMFSLVYNGTTLMVI